MKNPKKSLLLLIVISFFSSAVFGFLSFGCGSVANRFEDSLRYVKELEAKGPLTSLPTTLPATVVEDIAFMDGYYPDLKGSAAFERYITETDAMGDQLVRVLYVSFCLFLLSLGARIWIACFR